jgi:hypothetical protein
VTNSWKLITKYRQPDVYRRWLIEVGESVADGEIVGWLAKP